MKSSKRRKSRRWLLGILLILLVVPLLLFVASNLFLGSQKGGAFLQKNLNRRTVALDWKVAGARWSPWNGITVGQLSAHLDPEGIEVPSDLPPLLSLKEVNLKPYWGQLLRRKKLFREVLVDQPELQIPVELMFSGSSSPPPVKKAAPAPKQNTPPPAKPGPTPPPPARPTPKEKKSTGKAPAKKEQPEPPDERRLWLRLRKAKVRLYSLTLKKDFVVHDLDLDLPLAGPAAEGSMTWRDITLAGQSVLGTTTLPIAWTHPAWALSTQKLALQVPQFVDSQATPVPLDFYFGGSFAFRDPARTFRMKGSIPPQPFPDYIIQKTSQFHVGSSSLSLNFAGQGSVLDLATWRFDSEMAMKEVEAYSEIRGQHFLFDTAGANVDLRRTTLLVPSASLRSEQFSLMGNGQLSMGGDLLAVLRIVADAGVNDKLSDIAVGSNITRGWMSSWLRPLETPDRYYRDLHFEGRLPNAVVDTGKAGQKLPLPDIVRLLKHFIAVEVAEEIDPSP